MVLRPFQEKFPWKAWPWLGEVCCWHGQCGTELPGDAWVGAEVSRSQTSFIPDFLGSSGTTFSFLHLDFLSLFPEQPGLLEGVPTLGREMSFKVASNLNHSMIPTHPSIPFFSTLPSPFTPLKTRGEPETGTDPAALLSEGNKVHPGNAGAG